MKLTQKTLFQCFQKSRPQSPIVNTPPSESSLSDSQTQNSCNQSKTYSRQQDYLIPVHIRQSNNESYSNNNLLFDTTITDDDDDVSYSTEDFYRICPTIVNYQSSVPKFQFTKISSAERQMELFQQYTNDQSMIDWKSIFECLQDYRTKAVEQNQCEQLLWTDIYRPKTSKAYLGNHTRQIKRLNEWFSYWTRKLHNEQPKKMTGIKRKRAINDDDDDNANEDFDDNSSMSYDSCGYSKPEHSQLIFIHGSGTTSLVHALAEEHNFKITEINGSQSRARTPLLKQLEQVTSHHHLSFKRCPSDTIQSQGEKPSQEISSPLPAKKKVKNENGSIVSFFNQKKKLDQNDDEHKENKSHQRSTLPVVKEEPTKKLTNQTNNPKRRSKTKREISPPVENQFVSSVHVEKTSLIFFDEIETLTSDDNFWSCLKKLLETAKKPIILTSNSRTNPEDAIINLSKIGHYELIHLEQNEPELVCCFLRLILLIEMFEIPSFDDLLLLFQSCSYDLRRTLLTLQFLLQSSDNTKISDHSSNEKQTEVSLPKWQSSRIFDAMYFSRLNEQRNDSSLKEFFNDLTSKYASEYEQSHLLLVNQSKNNPNRIELYDTFKLFMQEQEIRNIIDYSEFYVDYRPYIRQICQSEQNRADECNSNRRLRHSLSFRGCTLQWSDFEILSAGIN